MNTSNKLVNTSSPIVVGITGASGASMADAVIKILLLSEVPVVTIISAAGRLVWVEEMNEKYGAGTHWLEYAQ